MFLASPRHGQNSGNISHSNCSLVIKPQKRCALPRIFLHFHARVRIQALNLKSCARGVPTKCTTRTRCSAKDFWHFHARVRIHARNLKSCLRGVPSKCTTRTRCSSKDFWLWKESYVDRSKDKSWLTTLNSWLRITIKIQFLQKMLFLKNDNYSKFWFSENLTAVEGVICWQAQGQVMTDKILILWKSDFPKIRFNNSFF